MAALLSLPLSAQDFEYQGIIYTPLTPTTVTTKAGSSTTNPGNNVSGVVVIPEKVSDGFTEFTVTNIGNYSFVRNNELTAVVLPDNVSIGMFSFAYNDNLEMLVIGKNVRLGTAMIISSPNIKDIYILDPTPPIGSANFTTDQTNGIKLHVPEGSVEKYQENSTFKWFKNIVEGTDYLLPGEEPPIPSAIYLRPDETADGATLQMLDGQFDWQSSADDIASVQADGTVTAHAFGRTTVTASMGEDIYASMEVFVTPIITVLYPEGVETMHRVVYNTFADITFTPQVGWKVHSITLDGEDVTSNVSVAGKYVSTEPVTDDCKISIITEKDADDKFTLRMDDNRTLIIEGADEGDSMVITNYNGNKTVYDWKAADVPFSEGGVFEVKITDAATNHTSFYRICIQ